MPGPYMRRLETLYNTITQKILLTTKQQGKDSSKSSHPIQSERMKFLSSGVAPKLILIFKLSQKLTNRRGVSIKKHMHYGASIATTIKMMREFAPFLCALLNTLIIVAHPSAKQR